MIQKAFYKRNLGIFILLFFSFSCTSNLDFNQVNTFKSTPVIVANFATFDASASQFLISGIEIPLAGVNTNFDVFRDAYFNQSLTRADLFFEFTNTLNKAFKINLYFLDNNNTPVYTVPFTISASTTGAPILVTKTEIFQNAKLDQLKSTKKIGFGVILAGPTLTASSLGSLKLRSSATVYLTLQ
jgi:hypothetical protein